jgi:branched-chain amino acid transport system substrate-binding protein
MDNLARKGHYARHNARRSGVTRLILFSVLVALLAGCRSKTPILVGFSGELTNSRGEDGVFCRDGIELAVAELNRNNGIRGRPIRLVVKDDRNNPDVARQVDADLVKEGVVAIIGHITSSQTAAVFAQNNQARMVVVNPVSSGSAFSRQRDYFFRVIPANDLLSQALARHVFQYRHIRQITGVYDLSNHAFAETFWQLFRQAFEQLGGTVQQELTFQAGQTDLQQLARQIQATTPEAVLVVASAVDTAFLVQYLRQQGTSAPVFSSTWAQTEQLIEKGGDAVEDLEMVAVYHPQNPYPAFESFVKQFTERYQRAPTFQAAYGYEAMLVLAHALEQTHGEARGLPDALLKVANLPGIQGVISLDEYGDVSRDIYIVQVKNGQFRVINTVPPEH